MKLTHRKRGFKSTPMDFLILFLVIVFPVISGTYLEAHDLASFATKTLMLFSVMKC